MCDSSVCAARRVRTALCGRTAVNPAPCHRSKHRRRLLFPNSRTSGSSRLRSACCSRRVDPGSRTTRGGQGSWSFGVNPPCRCHFSLVGVKFVFEVIWQYSSLFFFFFYIHILLSLLPLQLPPPHPQPYTHPSTYPSPYSGIRIGVHSQPHMAPLVSTPLAAPVRPALARTRLRLLLWNLGNVGAV